VVKCINNAAELLKERTSDAAATALELVSNVNKFLLREIASNESRGSVFGIFYSNYLLHSFLCIFILFCCCFA